MIRWIKQAWANYQEALMVKELMKIRVIELLKWHDKQQRIKRGECLGYDCDTCRCDLSPDCD